MNRRTFIKGIAKAALAIATAPVFIDRIFQPEIRERDGWINFGDEDHTLEMGGSGYFVSGRILRCLDNRLKMEIKLGLTGNLYIISQKKEEDRTSGR